MSRIFFHSLFKKLLSTDSTLLSIRGRYELFEWSVHHATKSRKISKLIIHYTLGLNYCIKKEYENMHFSWKMKTIKDLLLQVVLVLLIKMFTNGVMSDPDLREPDQPASDSTAEHGLELKSGEEEPRVFFFVPSVWNFITDPNNSAFFLLLVGFQVSKIHHRKVWETKPQNEILEQHL